MAEILSLPCRIDRAGARRLSDSLATLIATGRDPGPRDAQIRSLGMSLAALVQALDGELRRLEVSEDIEALTGSLKRLAAVARSYRDGGRG